MNVAKPLAERFYAKVGPQLPNGCMEWQGYCWSNGYGQITLKKPDRALAHRVAYSLVHGEIPDGMVVMHTCDNPRCVNVNHLRIGSQRENVADMVVKGRSRQSKLRPYLQDISKMRVDGYSHQSIADKYGVSRPLVTMLFTGKLPSIKELCCGD